MCGKDIMRAIVALQLIATGSDDEVRAFFGCRLRRSTRDRIAAAKALLERALDCPRKHTDDEGEIEREIQALIDMTNRAINGADGGVH